MLSNRWYFWLNDEQEAATVTVHRHSDPEAGVAVADRAGGMQLLPGGWGQHRLAGRHRLRRGDALGLVVDTGEQQVAEVPQEVGRPHPGGGPAVIPTGGVGRHTNNDHDKPWERTINNSVHLFPFRTTVNNTILFVTCHNIQFLFIMCELP